MNENNIANVEMSDSDLESVSAGKTRMFSREVVYLPAAAGMMAGAKAGAKASANSRQMGSW